MKIALSQAPSIKKHACSLETVSPCRDTRQISDTNALSRLLWNHNRHVVPHLLLSICCVWKLRLPSERMPMLCQCQCSQQQKAEKHSGVPEEGQQCYLFSFCLVFVLSGPSFCLLFCLRLMSRGWYLVAASLRHLGFSEAGLPVI